MAVQLTIKTVAAQTGLSAHTIRAWERRYGVLSPDRSDTNRRLYDAADVMRLIYLRKAVEAGHSIGQIANLPAEELQKLVASVPGREAPRDAVERCLQAAIQLDAVSLEAELIMATATRGIGEMLEQVVLPLIYQLDLKWTNGTLRIAQEHLASATLRTYLERVRASLPCAPHSPKIVVTTPSGQIHELGAVIVGVLAALKGWNVLYLGPNMPAEDIASAARQFGADAIGLSLVYPCDDPRIAVEMLELRRLLGPRLPILVGGRAANSYKEALDQAEASQVSSVEALKVELDRLRGVAA